ncbi:hypothetical protein, partial [Kozakia baliensis]
ASKVRRACVIDPAAFFVPSSRLCHWVELVAIPSKKERILCVGFSSHVAHEAERLGMSVKFADIDERCADVMVRTRPDHRD